MKKYISILLLVIIMFSFNSVGYAFLDTLLGAAGKSLPQNVSRVMNGSEFEYMAKEVQKLGYLFDMIQVLNLTKEQNIDNSAMMNMMLGNSGFVDFFMNSGLDLSEMTKEDIEEYILTRIEDILNNLDTTFKTTDFEGVDQDTKESVNEEIEKKMDSNIDNTLEEIFNREKTSDGTYGYYKYDNEGKTDREIYTEKVDELKEKYNDTLDFYSYIEMMYGDQAIEGSVAEFVDQETSNINILDNQIKEIDKGNLNYNIKMLVLLQAQANRINLKKLQSDKDLNQQLLIMNTILSKQNFIDEYNTIKANHFK